MNSQNKKEENNVSIYCPSTMRERGKNGPVCRALRWLVRLPTAIYRILLHLLAILSSFSFACAQFGGSYGYGRKQDANTAALLGQRTALPWALCPQRPRIVSRLDRHADVFYSTFCLVCFLWSQRGEWACSSPSGSRADGGRWPTDQRKTGEKNVSIYSSKKGSQQTSSICTRLFASTGAFASSDTS